MSNLTLWQGMAKKRRRCHCTYTMQVGSRRVLDLTCRDWTIHSSCSSSILLNCCNSTPSLHASLTIIRCLSLPRGALLTLVCMAVPADAPVFLCLGERGQLISCDPWQTLSQTPVCQVSLYHLAAPCSGLVEDKEGGK